MTGATRAASAWRPGGDIPGHEFAVVASADLDYLAVALIGPRAQVTSLTGSLPLYR
ncbi:DUF2000 family protein [Actinomyces succiniciruminis]|uniref:DUF2000 family protein n=1 Tax=Actinomyces succiniciruminis TaxID=1522002 RepID=UPI001B32FD23